MHKLSKKTCLLLMTLLASSVLAALPVRGSTGNILINTTTAPSPSISVPIGGTINLYFGGVIWSGGTIDLYLSQDGYAALNLTADIGYGPTFSVARLKNMTYIDTTTYSGYSIGMNWINGTIPMALNVPGGMYYIKAFDGLTAAVSVTDNAFTVTAAFEVVPSSGPGQAAIELKGYALPANGFANLSHNAGGWTTIMDLVQADANGKFVYGMICPDLLQVMPPGMNLELFSTITFQMVEHPSGLTLQDTFDQYRRGLVQVKGDQDNTATTGWLYGNTTDFWTSYGATVAVQGSLIIAGKYFHPGTLQFLWDGTSVVGTTTANSTGGFNTTITVPITSKGVHTVVIDDGKIVFTFDIYVRPTLILVPTSGPVGTAVTAYGYGFEASTSTTTYNVTIWWDYTDFCTQVMLNLTITTVDTNGHFVGWFNVPATVGGSHTVNATEDDPATTWATATFTVTPTLTIVPDVLTNNGTIVTITVTGLSYTYQYDLYMDNGKNWYSGDASWWTVMLRPDCTGTLTIDILDTGWSPGLHSIALYRVVTLYALPVLQEYVFFTVMESSVVVEKLDEIIDMIGDLNVTLLGIDGDIATLMTDVGMIKGDVTSIVGDIATIKTDIGTIKVDVSTAASAASAAQASAAAAATAAAAAQTAAEGAQSSTGNISTSIYAAIILSLIAALASIVAVITLQRKVA